MESNLPYRCRWKWIYFSPSKFSKSVSISVCLSLISPCSLYSFLITILLISLSTFHPFLVFMQALISIPTSTSSPSDTSSFLSPKFLYPFSNFPLSLDFFLLISLLIIYFSSAARIRSHPNSHQDCESYEN